MRMKGTIIFMNLLAGISLGLSAQGQTQPKLSSRGERALIAYLKVIPGAEAEFLKAAQDVIRKSRQEPGCLVYTLHQSVTDPTQLVFYEVFKTHCQ